MPTEAQDWETLREGDTKPAAQPSNPPSQRTGLAPRC